MCGINGLLSSSIDNGEERVGQMNQKMAHRGPDDHGVWHEQGVALGHQRLSIIDLSDSGHQPMVSHCGRYVMVFNGEIYNYKILRKQFNYPYLSQTDSEVVLAAWTHLGAGAVKLFEGMFAIAVWDRQTKTMTLVRDRMGVKPLYYSQCKDGFVFSSEIRSLLASGLVKRQLDADSLVDYLRYQTVQAPQTIIKDVYLQEPGTILCYNPLLGTIEKTVYWNFFDKAEVVKPRNYEDVKSTIRALFFKAVEKRLVADVPFGAFLSGGIDSSAVVGAMAQNSTNTVRTFNIAFAEEAFSEAKYARHIAQMHQTQHTEIKLSPQQFLSFLPEALAALDHPSGDGPNTWVVSKVTKEAGVSMALSGLGGDELFAGYAIFKRMVVLEKYKCLWRTPLFLRRFLGKLLITIRPGVASLKMKHLLSLPRYRFEDVFALSRQALMDEQIVDLLSREVLPSHQAVSYLHAHLQTKTTTCVNKVSMAEMRTYMQNVLLRDSDQMSMAHALELRVPFMDHELIEYVLSLPDAYKMGEGPKQLLVDSLPDLLPDYIVNRPKMGFEFPWREWLKNELFDYADQRLRRISKRPYFKEEGVMELWSRFTKGDQSITYSRIWPLVVLEEWMELNEIN